MNKSRLEAFSDGVFAIVITLLVLDIRPDALGGSGGEMFMRAGPRILVYALSFVLVGMYWVSHHHMLSFVERTDRAFLWLNLLLLLVVAFIPYPAALMSSTHGDVSSIRIYATTLCLCNLLGGTLWAHATSRHRLVGLPPESFARFVLAMHLAQIAVYALAGLLAGTFKTLSEVLLAFVPSFFVLPNPFIERRVRAAHAAVRRAMRETDAA